MTGTADDKPMVDRRQAGFERRRGALAMKLGIGNAAELRQISGDMYRLHGREGALSISRLINRVSRFHRPADHRENVSGGVCALGGGSAKICRRVPATQPLDVVPRIATARARMV